MSNFPEYATYFDKDLQTDVVQVRCKKTDVYEKYVFDMKLNHFVRAPEVVKLHDLQPLYITKCDRHSHIFFCKNLAKQGAIFKYIYRHQRIYRVQCTCCDYDEAKEGTYFNEDYLEFKANFCQLSHALEASLQVYTLRDLVDETSENFLWIRPFHSVICLKSKQVVVMMMKYPNQYIEPYTFDVKTQKFIPSQCDCTSCSIINQEYDFFEHGNQGAGFQRCHRDRHGLPLICLSINWSSKAQGSMEVFCDEQGFIGRYKWNKDQKCFDLQEFLDVRVFRRVVDEKKRPALLYDDGLKVMYQKKCEELNRLIYFTYHQRDSTRQKATFNTFTHQFEYVSCNDCYFDSRKSSMTMGDLDHDEESMMTGKTIKLSQSKYKAVEKMIEANDGSFVKMGKATIKDLRTWKSEDFPAYYAPPQSVLPTQILESDGTERWIVGYYLLGSMVYLYGMDGKVKLHRMEEMDKDVGLRTFISVDADGNDLGDEVEVSDTPTSTTFPLPSNSSLCDPKDSSSLPITATGYTHCPHYNHTMLFANCKYGYEPLEFLLTSDALVQVNCSECRSNGLRIRKSVDEANFAYENGYMYQLEETNRGTDVWKMVLKEEKWEFVERLPIRFEKKFAECFETFDEEFTDKAFDNQIPPAKTTRAKPSEDDDEPDVDSDDSHIELEDGSDEEEPLNRNEFWAKLEESEKDAVAYAIGLSLLGSGAPDVETVKSDSSEVALNEPSVVKVLSSTSSTGTQLTSKPSGLLNESDPKEPSTAHDLDSDCPDFDDENYSEYFDEDEAYGVEEEYFEDDEEDYSDDDEFYRQVDAVIEAELNLIKEKLEAAKNRDGEPVEGNSEKSTDTSEDKEDVESTSTALMSSGIDSDGDELAEPTEPSSKEPQCSLVSNSDIKKTDKKLHDFYTSEPAHSSEPSSDDKDDVESTRTALDHSEYDSAESQFDDEEDGSEYSDEEESDEDTDADDQVEPSFNEPYCLTTASSEALLPADLFDEDKESTTTAVEPSDLDSDDSDDDGSELAEPYKPQGTARLTTNSSVTVLPADLDDEDTESTTTALEPSEIDSDGSDFDDEEDSEYSDEECSTDDEPVTNEPVADASTIVGVTASEHHQASTTEPTVSFDDDMKSTTTAIDLDSEESDVDDEDDSEYSDEEESESGEDDQESTTTAIEPSDLDSDGSDVDNDDDSEYSDEEESGSDDGDDGNEPVGEDPKPKCHATGVTASEHHQASTTSSTKPTVRSDDGNKSTTTAKGSSDVDSDGSEYSDEEESGSDDDDDKESTSTAAEPSDLDSDDSDVSDEDDSEASDKEDSDFEADPTTPITNQDLSPIYLNTSFHQFILFAYNHVTRRVGKYDKTLKEIRTPIKFNELHGKEFKTGDWIYGDKGFNYEVDTNGRLQRLEFSQAEETYVRVAPGEVKMLDDPARAALLYRTQFLAQFPHIPFVTKEDPTPQDPSCPTNRDLSPIYVDMCPDNQKYILFAYNHMKRKVGKFEFIGFKNLVEVKSCLKFKCSKRSDFEDWLRCTLNVSYGVDEDGRLAKFQYSEVKKKFVKVDPGRIKMLEVVEGAEESEDDEDEEDSDEEDGSKGDVKDRLAGSAGKDEGSEEGSDDSDADESEEEIDPEASLGNCLNKRLVGVMEHVHVNDDSMSDVYLTEPEPEESSDEEEFSVVEEQEAQKAQQQNPGNQNCRIS